MSVSLRSLKCGGLFLALLAASCAPNDRSVPDPLARTLALPDEKLSSLDVVLEFDPNGAGCVQLDHGALPALETPGDYCPDSAGTPLHPLLYQSGRRVRVLVTVTAIGTKNSYPFPVWGNIALSPSVGTVFSGSPVYLENGKVERAKVVFVNSPGHVQLWAEGMSALRLGGVDGTQVPATFSAGVSSVLWMGNPTVQDIQRADNDLKSPLEGQRVDVVGDNMMVTRLAPTGFYLQDLAAAPVAGGGPWNAVFAYAFNGVDHLAVGSRIIKLRGAVAAFQGMTQVAEPEFVLIGSACSPPRPTGFTNMEDMDSDEGGAARQGACPPGAVCQQTANGDRCLLPNDPYTYDRLGRFICHTPTQCPSTAATPECPAGTACSDRAEWDTVDASGAPAHTCQACPVEFQTLELWTTSCGPIYRGDDALTQKMRNESYEATLIQLDNIRVSGLNLGDDFFRSGYESFGQWKAMDAAGNCATVVSLDAAPLFDAVAAQTQGMRLKSLTGTLRQTRFKSGSAFWTLDVRHKDDIVPAP